MRADRLIQIMILLANNGKMTAKQLSQQLEVSYRTILRDMDALSFAGIPVVAERGQAGGWRLPDHFRSAISGLKLEELKPLFILPSEQMLEELGMQAHGTLVRHKLLASLPSGVKNEARSFFDKIHLDSGSWKPSRRQHAALRTVQQALWDDLKLTVHYAKADGTSSRRKISPLGLVSKGSAWYAVALTEQGELRSFKVSRIVQANIEDETFERPKTFHLASYWQQSKAEFTESLPSFEIKVLAHPSIMGRLTFTDKFVEKVDEAAAEDGDMIPVTLKFNSEQDAIGYVLGFGGSMKLVEPKAWIGSIVRQAQSVIAMHSDQPI